MELSEVEKVKLGHEHGVASWLIEGVTSLVERNPDLSPDALEAALGIRIAFRIVSLQARFQNISPISTVLINGTLYPSFPLISLRCRSCPERMFSHAGISCHSCSRPIGPNDRGAVYLRTNLASLRASGNDHCVSSEMDKLQCASCTHRLVTRPVACQACQIDFQLDYTIYIMHCAGRPDIYTPPSAIQEAFQGDLAGCDM